MENSFKELVEKYMQCDKKTLAEMLALIELEKDNDSKNDLVTKINELEKSFKKEFDYNHPKETKEIPWGEKIGDNPKYNRLIQGCKTWADCTNPNYDCFNCPLRYKFNGNGWPNGYTPDTIKTGNTSADLTGAKSTLTGAKATYYSKSEYGDTNPFGDCIWNNKK